MEEAGALAIRDWSAKALDKRSGNFLCPSSEERSPGRESSLSSIPVLAAFTAAFSILAGRLVKRVV